MNVVPKDIVASIEAEARKELGEERNKTLKVQIKAQLQRIAAAKSVVAAEELKYEDLKQQIADGTL